MFKKAKLDYEAHCEVCQVKISVANKGQCDLKQHLASAKHAKNIRAASSSKTVENLFISQATTKDLKISAAEATLAFHVHHHQNGFVHHHQNYRSCDCSTKLFRKLFRDSEIASNISSAKIKTEAIINNVLAPNSVNIALKRIEDENISYIGVCTDASNHGSLKIFPVLIQYFDREYGIQLRIVELKSLQNEKSETICDLISTTLEHCHLKNKCIAFTADNCNTNFGGVQRKGQNNVFFRLKNVLQKEVIGVGCPAHILHNCI